MQASADRTVDRIVAAGHRRIAMQGYSGFSFADIADEVGIRKPSIHHHFASKPDLAIAVITRSKAAIEAQAAMLETEPNVRDVVGDYVHFWERCIAEGSEPFCLAGVLAAELPHLPAVVAEAVAGHFLALREWLSAALALGVRQGRLILSETPAQEAERFMATVYGAMLMARVFDDPARFARIMARTVRELLDPPTPAVKHLRPK